MTTCLVLSRTSWSGWLSVTIKLDRRFYNQARGRFGKYAFDVGILNDKPHYEAVPGSLKGYAGGPARRQSRVPSGKTIAQVSKELRTNLGINFYTAPFKARKNRDILRFAKSFFLLCAGKQQRRQVENYLQAIVRNPILRGDYGSNSPLTAKIKGFDRLMIDTSQLFRAIRAKTRRVNVSR